MRNVVVLPEPDGPSSAKNSPGRDVKVDAVQRSECAVALDDALEPARGRCCCHLRPPPLTAPTVNPLTMCRCASSPSTITGRHREHRAGREPRPLRLLD